MRWHVILLPFVLFSSLPPYPLLSACRYAYTLAVTVGSRAEIPVSREASGLGSARGDVYAQASLAGKTSPSLTFLPHVVVRRHGFPSTDIAKLSGVDTNQLEQRCGKVKITKTLSHASSKEPAPFGNATLGQAPASGSASFLCC
ncbi:hypothetical protein YC2023_002561 [Brassica napus]